MLRLRQQDLEFQEIEGEVVALDVRESRYIGINESGATLWAMLKEGTEEEALVAHLIDSYGLPRDQAEKDVRAFVSDLESKDLIDRLP